MICDKKEIGERPTLEQLTIRIWQKRLNVSARRMFDFYEGKEWKSIAGEPLNKKEQTELKNNAQKSKMEVK